MSFYLIIILLFFITSLLVFYGLKNFHKDNYQFLATIPIKKIDEHTYRGINLTFYGLISAFSCAMSIFIFIVLLKYINFPTTGIYIILVTILLLGIPSSKIVAYIIEKRRHTMTIGGAVFVCGVLSAPVIISAIRLFDLDMSVFFIPTLSALSIAYAYGEGIGRLACLSFGCCYGKPLEKTSYSNILKYFTVRFKSKTKKAVYDSNYDDISLINTQAMTVISYLTISILSIFLFANKYYKLALFTSLCLTQLMRFLIEFLRNDYRGNTKISVYQIFSIILMLYGLVFVFFFSTSAETQTTERLVFSSVDIIIVMIVFALTFLNTGISKVTFSNIRFYVDKNYK